MCVRQRQGKQPGLCPPLLWFIVSELYWYSLFMPHSSHCFPLTWALHKSRCDRQAAPFYRLVRRGGLPWATAQAPTHHHQQMCSAICCTCRAETTNSSKHAEIFTYPYCSFLLSAGCSFNWNISTDILAPADGQMGWSCIHFYSVISKLFSQSEGLHRVRGVPGCTLLLSNPSFTPGKVN